MLRPAENLCYAERKQEGGNAVEQTDTAALRREKKAARQAIPPWEREQWNREIVHRIVESSAYRQAHIVMSYRAIRSEVDLRELDALARRQGKRMAYPCCISATEIIALEPWGPESWSQGRYGIWEPMVERSNRVAPQELELICCPCTAFDSQGNRLGMGGGCYDRFLPQCENAVIAAVAYELQWVERLEAAPWDHPMDWVFTERRTLDCQKP